MWYNISSKKLKAVGKHCRVCSKTKPGIFTGCFILTYLPCELPKKTEILSMFDTLSIHLGVTPTVFLELLIGLSPIVLSPPEAEVPSWILNSAFFFSTDRNATTEDIFGYGLGVDHA